MLTNLVIKDFTIIDHLDINLQPKMTVLTGETGAGKSIIIDTLEIALGARSKEPGDITASFNIENNVAAKNWLQNQELANDDECIIRRTINIDGRSRSTINGIPCPQQLTRELGSLLVNIHGQHEHQALLKRDLQRDLLDDFANHKQLCNEVKNIYLDWQKTNTKLTELQTLTNNQQSQTDLLNYQIKELDELALEQDELENLHQEHKQLVNAEELLANCNSALNIITENNLANAQNALTNIKDIDSKINTAHELLNTASIQAQEAAYELQHYLDKVNLNPEHLASVEQRLNTIHNLARKHHVQPEQLFDLHKNLATQLQQLTNAAENAKKITEKLQTLTTNYQTTANKLTTSRKQAAQKLCLAITEQMQQLNMPHGKFDILFTPNKNNNFSASGLEQLEFLVSTNPGQAPQALNKVASGGELSRISLAIQVITASQAITPTLIFDEVDVGIGGKTAEIVGQLLQKLGNTTQVICVTHLSQVAAQGHHHLQVNKQTSKTSTTAEIKTLDQESKITEIARMLGGIKITEQTLAHAKEMCENSKNRL
jgi:DNA repair protein RecN (Recombination protein N)